MNIGEFMNEVVDVFKEGYYEFHGWTYTMKFLFGIWYKMDVA